MWLSKNKSRIQTVVEIALIVVCLVFSLFAMLQFYPAKISGDGAGRFQAISDLLEHGKLSSVKYSMVGSLFSIPLWLLGKVYQTSEWWCVRYNLIVFATGLLLFYLLLKDRVERGLIRKFILILIVASMFPNHLNTYYGEVFTAILVGVGIMAAVIGPRFGGWIAVVLGGGKYSCHSPWPGIDGW